jgi:hypothetical protein
MFFVCFWRNSPHLARASSYTRFLDHIQRRTTVVRTPLDECSARRRDVYVTTHNTLTSMPPAGFIPSLSRRAAADPSLRPRGHWDRHRNMWVTITRFSSLCMYRDGVCKILKVHGHSINQFQTLLKGSVLLVFVNTIVSTLYFDSTISVKIMLPT